MTSQSQSILAGQPNTGASGMMERVTTAIVDAADIGHDHYIDNPTEVARAALTALREPTDAMLRAAGMLGPNRSRTYWQAMIDAALAGEG